MSFIPSKKAKEVERLIDKPIKSFKIDYSQFAIPKPTSKPKTSKPLKAKKRLQSKSKHIAKELKEAVLKEKGGLCFMGLCEHCGGLAEATDPHHFPHKGPHATPDEVKYLWPANRICHDYYHDHPLEERELFKKIESEGWLVIWKIPVKDHNS